MRTLWDLIDPMLERLVAPSKGPKQAPPANVTSPVPNLPDRAKGPAPAFGPAPDGRDDQPPDRSPPRPRAKPPRGRNGQAEGRHDRAAPVQPGRTQNRTAVPASPARPATRRLSGATDADDASMQARYDAVTRLMLEGHRIRVRKWRKGMSGIAWYVKYRDGTIQRLIEAPRPKGPMSAAIFLHEVGHHAIGFHTYKPRCLEEYHAWRWSLEAMERHGLNITDAVRLRMHRSLWYAVQKARRRGIKEIPAELAPFVEKPSFARKRTRRRL